MAGLYDYGPTGCAIMANLISEWRQHFVLEENMLEVNCSAITPHYVLQCVLLLPCPTNRTSFPC